MKNTMKIGIIGGTGKMGRFFASVFAKAGFEVLVSGTKTPVTSEEIAEVADIVMISVPIHLTDEIIASVAPIMRDEQILCDLTSLKVRPVTTMLTSAAEVIGLHPMFGPSVASLSGQTIIVTPARCRDESCTILTDVFTQQGACITYCTPEEHDRMMAIIQGLTHFKTLVMAETLRKMGMKPDVTTAFMSPVYQIEMNIAGRLLAQDASLYADILTLNPYIPEVLQTSSRVCQDIVDLIISQNTEGFCSLFNADADWFGSFCASAMRDSDVLIRTMVQNHEAT